MGNVVWGMEFPELIFSENLSIHDLRLRDTGDDDGVGSLTSDTTNPDPDFDQYRIPEGSTWLELMCPRSLVPDPTQLTPSPPRVGGQNDWVSNSVQNPLYTLSGGVPQLNLAATTPGGDPIWRIGISAHRPNNESVAATLHRSGAVGAETQSLTYQVQNGPQAASNGLAPVMPGSPATVTFDIDFDRVILFTAPASTPPNLAPGTPDARVFYYRGGDTLVEGGGYMVLGPRQTTYFGSQDLGGGSHAHNPSAQRIYLDNTIADSVQTRGLDDVTTYQKIQNSATARNITDVAIKSPRTMLIGADVPGPLWTMNGVRNWIGLNISEPLPAPAQYYSIPTHEVNSSDASAPGDPYPGYADLPMDGYRDYDGAGTGNLPDGPFDATNPILTDTHGPDPQTGVTAGTVLNVRTAYIQRLANPEADYNVMGNPYITVDWTGLDLTVFNGESDTNPAEDQFALQTRYRDGASVQDIHDQDMDSEVAVAPPLNTGSGGANRDGITGRAFLSASTARVYNNVAYIGMNEWNGTAVSPSYLNVELGQSDTASPFSSSSLGFLNVGRPISDDADAVANSLLNNTEGFGFPLDIAVPFDGYDGCPRQSVASLYWFNRPFANSHELMVVPHTGPGDFSRSFTATNARGPYQADQTTLSDPFGHLFNYFDPTTTKTTSSLDTSVTPNQTELYWMKPESGGTPLGSDLSILLELVENPVLYLDSAIHYADDTYRAPPNLSTPSRIIRQLMLDDLRDTFAGNQMSQSVPGKININTVSDGAVWKGIEFNYLKNLSDRLPSSAGPSPYNIPRLPFFDDSDPSDADTLADFRRGYAVMNNTDSTMYTANALQINPNLNLSSPTRFAGVFRSGIGTNIAPIQSRSTYSAKAVNSSLLRQAGPNGADPILLRAQNLDPDGGVINTNDTNHSDVQPYEAYRRIMRLPNLVSQQSNVFEVRLTIGLFEYDPVTNSVGREHLDGSGKPARHQAVYYIDRSIPVGFVPGQDLNTAKTILYRRHLD